MENIARAGLTAKAVVYVLLGVLAFMAAFGINETSAEDTSKSGVFDFIMQQPAGSVLLWIVTAGLTCYFLWRVFQTFTDSEGQGKDVKGLGIRGRYLFSGLVYGSLAVQSARMLLFHKKNSGDNSQDMVQELLSKPLGQWLVGFVAAIFLAVGFYQIWYGLSEKYRKHVNKSVPAKVKPILLNAGKIGYVARGVVWLILSYLFFQAAFSANASEAGNTSKALNVISNVDYGPYLLALIGFGLICYGLFNFVRARFEKFG